MPTADDMLTVAQAAQDLGLSPVSIRAAVRRKTIAVVRLDGRTNLIARQELERYRRERLGKPGKRKPTTTTRQPAEAPAESE